MEILRIPGACNEADSRGAWQFGEGAPAIQVQNADLVGVTRPDFAGQRTTNSRSGWRVFLPVLFSLAFTRCISR
jgi:hypothetical protein